MKPQNVTKIRVAGGGMLILGYSRLVAAENGGVCGVTFGKVARLYLWQFESVIF